MSEKVIEREKGRERVHARATGSFKVFCDDDNADDDDDGGGLVEKE